jgi:hypothetical protein
MQQIVNKVQTWLPTLLSKKLGVAIAAFIAEFNTKPHQTTKQIVIAVLGAVYIAAQAYLDSRVPAAPEVPAQVDPEAQLPDVPQV